MQNQTRKFLDNTTRCLNPVFLLEQPRNYQGGTNLAHKLQRGPTTWKDMLENAWNGIANWQTKRRSNFSKFLTFVWKITKSKRRIGKKVNCQKFTSILYLNACTWHVLEDLLFSGQSTTWHDLSHNGLNIHFTSDYRQCCHVGNAAQHCRLGLFQEDSKYTSIGVLCIVWTSTICTDQLDVQKVDQMSDVDNVTTHTHSSQGQSQLYIFEDNEAVIKMI